MVPNNCRVNLACSHQSYTSSLVGMPVVVVVVVVVSAVELTEIEEWTAVAKRDVFSEEDKWLFTNKSSLC